MSGQENNRPNELVFHAPVTLRRFQAEDNDALYQAVTESLDHLRPWLPWAQDYSRESAEQYLANSIRHWDDGTEYNYAMLTDGVLVGCIGLMARIGPGGLEIGYWVHRAYAGRGLATAAAGALVEQAFRLPGVDHVEIVHDELNVPSGKIPARLGFTEIERHPLDPPAPGGTGIGVVWRLTRKPGEEVT